MNIGLIGYGAMGKLVEAQAAAAGDSIGARIQSGERNLTAAELSRRLQGLDLAIDFSISEAVVRNIEACLEAGVPLVEGTTGWSHREAEVDRLVQEKNGALLYGANFSIGVNVFYRIVARAAELFSQEAGYAPFIEEAHHSRKRDAPSGTALRLKQVLSERIDRDISVASTRAGHIPGTHRVGFDSAADQILLMHTARSREGFAAGALWGGRWLCGRTGMFEFSRVFDEILNAPAHEKTEKGLKS